MTAWAPGSAIAAVPSGDNQVQLAMEENSKKISSKLTMPNSIEAVHRSSAGGTMVEFPDQRRPQPDFASGIADNTWAPQVSRGENGSYYAVCRTGGLNKGLRIYRNTGDPASTAWVNVLNLYNLEALKFPDIEVVSSADRGFVVYKEEGENMVECFWFQLSDPTNYGFSTVGEILDEGAYISLTTDQVEFTDAYLYICWKFGDGIVNLNFTRSLDLGLSWEIVNSLPCLVGYMYNGNAITYCPGNNHVFILFTHSSNGGVYLAESEYVYGIGDWSLTSILIPALGTISSGGLTSCGDYILATFWGDYAAVDNDVFWVYSDDAGDSWSGLNQFSTQYDQTYPSCTCNTNGYFSMMFYTESPGESMVSSLATFDDLTPTGWTTAQIDDNHPCSGVSSACMEVGGNPLHGGAWSDGASPFSTSFLGWASGYDPAMRINLKSYTTPVLIPSIGGSFPYKMTIENAGVGYQTFDVWIDVTRPNGMSYGPVLGPTNLTEPGGWVYNTTLTQYVPPGAAAGDYSLNGYVGVYPDEIWTCDNLLFTKAPPIGNDAGGGMEGWFCEGDLPSEEAPAAKANPPEQLRLDASPNPFNPSTALRFEVPTSSYVSLRVFDLAGRLVQELVNDWREAGIQEVVFDGSDLVSGVYLYRLQAGSVTASGKMVLMK